VGDGAAGEATESTIQALAGVLERGDTIVDGGNTKWRTTSVAARSWPRAACTTSTPAPRGVWGLQNGYCLMVGGDKAPVDRLAPVFTTLAPPDGWLHVGGIGAGHYVKMIHNGIEYAMMQGYAEASSSCPRRSTGWTCRRSPSSGIRARSSARGCSS